MNLRWCLGAGFNHLDRAGTEVMVGDPKDWLFEQCVVLRTIDQGQPCRTVLACKVEATICWGVKSCSLWKLWRTTIYTTSAPADLGQPGFNRGYLIKDP